ncbi:hypothetical protein FRC12_011947 [Ceratobasidium sp. 428]|nr:hypothetical protein FRC12_011947 [Ceratobasidium sp. 428]
MSYVEEILNSAPQGSNPYAYAANLLDAKLIPRQKSFDRTLVVLGSFAAVNFISTLTTVVVLWRRSRSGSGIGFWSFKARYGHPRFDELRFQLPLDANPVSSGIPYITPNTLTMYLFWDTIFMILTQLIIGLRFATAHFSSLQGKSSLFFWYSFAYSCNGIGIWLSAFGTLYTILLPRLWAFTSSEHHIASIMLHPVLLNSVCLTPPLILFIAQTTTSALAAVTWSKLVKTNIWVVNMLDDLATQWSRNRDVDTGLREQAIEAGPLLVQKIDTARSAYQRSAGTCAVWYLLCLILFIPTAVWLMSIISKSVNHQTRPARSCVVPISTAPSHPGQTHAPKARIAIFSTPAPAVPCGPIRKDRVISSPTSDGVGNGATRDDATKRLRWAYITVGLQFLATFLYTAVAAGAWLWTLIHARSLIGSGKLRSSVVLWCMGVLSIVGCFVNFFVLLRVGKHKERPRKIVRSIELAQRKPWRFSRNSEVISDMDLDPSTLAPESLKNSFIAAENISYSTA